jgi:hypothetical protein
MNLLPILSNYQEGSRNAKVYKTHGGEYGVLVYDAQDDYNGFASFSSEQDADDFAEDWVSGHDTI